jgi:hypothetical protein
LDNHCSVADYAGKRNVADRDGDWVATSKLAIDGEIEECQIPFRAGYLQSCSNAPDLARFERRLLTDDVASVPVTHGSSPMPPSAAAALNTSKRM